MVDLLKELRLSGLSFHVAAVDARQLSTAALFSIDIHPRFEVHAAMTGVLRLAAKGAAVAESGLPVRGAMLTQESTGDGLLGSDHVALAAHWQNLWSSSEELYFRCLFRLTQVRHARTIAHRDLSTREVHKAAGLLEHGFSLCLQQRETLSSAFDHCAVIQSQLNQLRLLDQDFGGKPVGGRERYVNALAAQKAVGSSLGPQRALFVKLRHVDNLCSQALHLCLESATLFELHASPPQQQGDTHRGALMRVATLLKDCSSALRVRCSRMPCLRSRSVLLTAKHASLITETASEARQHLAALTGAVAALKAGEAAHLAPLLSKLGDLAVEEVDAEPEYETSAELPSTYERSDGEAVDQAAEDGAADGGIAAADSERASLLVNGVEQATSDLLLAMQGLRGLCLQAENAHGQDGEADAKESERPDDCEDETSDRSAEKNIRTQHVWLQRLLSSARADHVISSIASVVARLSACTDAMVSPEASRVALRAAAALSVSELTPALQLHLAALRWSVHQALEYHCSLVRLQLVLTNLFHAIFSKGFCTASEEENTDEKGEGGKLEDDVEGTGMGEGTGKQDVSEELQDEGQIEGDSSGAQNEQQNGDGGQPEDGNDERAKKDEGVEMTSAFDGDLKDCEKEDPAEASGEEGNNEEEEAMGGPNKDYGDDEEVVDERLWDKDDDDEDLKPEEGEKIERDASVRVITNTLSTRLPSETLISRCFPMALYSGESWRRCANGGQRG